MSLIAGRQISGSVASASYALTASFALNGGGGSSIETGSFATTGSNRFIGNQTITGSILMSGSSFISGVDYVDFDTTSSNAGAVGRLKWNDTDGTLDLGLKGGNVTLQIGQEEIIRVVNKTGVNLTEAGYQVVRLDGAQGNRVKVALAKGDVDANSLDTLGLVTENIDNNQEGFVTTAGLVRGINTTGGLQGETWSDGDAVYLSPITFGGITNIVPTAPSHSVRLGYVVQSNPSNGSIFVKVDNGYELDELHNVKINTGSLSSGDLLIRSGSVWVNSKQLTGSYTIAGSLNATSFSGSLQGTATTASYAATSSYSTNFTVGSRLTIDETLTDYASVNSTIVGSNNLFTQATGSYTAAMGKYTIYSGANARAGEFMTTWNGTNTTYTDTSTTDIGDTSKITFNSTIVTGNIQINADALLSGFTVKMLVTFI